MERSKLSRKRTKKSSLLEREQNCEDAKRTKIIDRESDFCEFVEEKIERVIAGNIVNDVNSLERVEKKNESAEEKIELRKHQTRITNNARASLYKCNVCEKDITHMNEERRNQHMNKCIDRKKEGANETKIEYTLECFFCHKTIPADKRNAHVKMCSRSCGANEDKLIEIVRLMEKQAEERRAVGLTFPPVKKNQSRIRNRTKIPSKMDSDLQMALALSISLKEEKDRQMDYEPTQFDTHLAAASHSPSAGRTRKKILNKVVPLLISRTTDERNNIISDNIASVLEEETKETAICLTIGDLVGRTSVCTRKTANNSSLRVEEHSIMWKKAALGSNITRDSFYVSQLEPISPSKIITGSKLKRLSQIPGRGSSQIPVIDIDVKIMPEKSILDAQKLDREGYAESDEFNCSGFFADEAKYSAFEDSDSIDGLVNDFGAMVANSAMSDVKIITKDGITVPAHSFVLYARCAALHAKLKESLSSQTTLTLNWTEVTSKVVVTFLKFVYCGILNDDCDEVIDQLDYLATRHHIQQLKERLAKLTKRSYLENESLTTLVNRDTSSTNEIRCDANEEHSGCEGKYDSRIEDCISPELLPLCSDDDIEPVERSSNSSPIITSSITPCGPNNNYEINQRSTYNNTVETTLNFHDSTDEVKEVVELDLSPSPNRNTRNKFDKTSPQGASSNGRSVGSNDYDQEPERCFYSPAIKLKLQQIEESLKGTPDVIRFNKKSNDVNHAGDSSLRNCYSQPEFQNVSDNDVWCNFDDNGFDADLERVKFQVVDSEVTEHRSICSRAESNDSVVVQKPNRKRCITRKKITNKQVGKIISASQPITPMPEFTEMDTPELKNQLKKFGIRQLPRKKAVRLLAHVYEETHPMVTDNELDDSIITDQLPQNKEVDLNSSQSSVEYSDHELLEETYFTEEQQIPPGKNQIEALKKFIRENSDIQRMILLYEPINIRELHNKVKGTGIKITLSTLKEFLDEQCITFTLPRDRPFNGKGKRRT